MTAPTGADVVRTAARIVAQPGLRYGSFDCTDRCHPNLSGCCDCSGLTSDTLALLGVGQGCEGSFAQSRRFHAAHTGLPYSQAIWTPGAFGFQGINEGQGGIPGKDEGHVGIFVGDGIHTLEARSHFAGVGMFYAASLRWDWCGMPVGVTRAGSSAQPSPTPNAPAASGLTATEETTTMIALPPSATTPKGEVGTARAVPELNLVLLESGGRLDGDVPVAGDKSGTKHYWAPPASAAVPGWHLLGIADMRPVTGEHAIVARFGFPNGDTGTYKTAIVG